MGAKILKRFVAVLAVAFGLSCADEAPLINLKCGETCYAVEVPAANIGVCTAGRWDCSINACIGAIGPADEVCDGLDNDCNGVADDVSPEFELCYTGPPNTAGIGVCAPGYFVCSGGGWICYGDIVPRDKGCGADDNDCDGAVDNATDIIVVLDESGSMEVYWGMVLSAVMQHALGHPWARYGLLVSPAWDYPETRLEINLVPALEFASALTEPEDSRTEDEAVLEALVKIVDSQNPYGLNWSPGAARRVLWLFSDEPARGYGGSDLIDVLADTPTYVFTRKGPRGVDATYEFAYAVGDIYPLDVSYDELLGFLQETTGGCGGN